MQQEYVSWKLFLPWCNYCRIVRHSDHIGGNVIHGLYLSVQKQATKHTHFEILKFFHPANVHVGGMFLEVKNPKNRTPKVVFHPTPIFKSHHFVVIILIHLYIHSSRQTIGPRVTNYENVEFRKLCTDQKPCSIDQNNRFLSSYKRI